MARFPIDPKGSDVIELRCPEKECKCSPNGKLLVKIYNLPEEYRNKGLIIEVSCPLKRSRLINLKV